MIRRHMHEDESIYFKYMVINIFKMAQNTFKDQCYNLLTTQDISSQN